MSRQETLMFSYTPQELEALIDQHVQERVSILTTKLQKVTSQLKDFVANQIDANKANQAMFLVLRVELARVQMMVSQNSTPLQQQGPEIPANQINAFYGSMTRAIEEHPVQELFDEYDGMKVTEILESQLSSTEASEFSEGDDEGTAEFTSDIPYDSSPTHTTEEDDMYPASSFIDKDAPLPTMESNVQITPKWGLLARTGASMAELALFSATKVAPTVAPVLIRTASIAQTTFETVYGSSDSSNSARLSRAIGVASNFKTWIFNSAQAQAGSDDWGLSVTNPENSPQEKIASAAEPTNQVTEITAFFALPLPILAGILFFTVDPLVVTDVFFISAWMDQRRNLWKLRLASKALYSMIPQVLSNIDCRDVFNPLVAVNKNLNQSEYPRYRRQISIKPLIITNTKQTHQRFILPETLSFDLIPTETMYHSPLQYFRPSFLTSGTRSIAKLCVIVSNTSKSDIQAGIHPQLNSVIELNIDGTSCMTKLQVNLLDDVSRTTQLDVSRQQDGSQTVHVSYNVRRDLDLSMAANPGFERCLDGSCDGLLTRAAFLPWNTAKLGLQMTGFLKKTAKKVYTRSEKLEAFQEWLSKEKERAVIVYQISIVQVVVPVAFLFGGF